MIKNLERAQPIIYDNSKQAIDFLLHITLKLKQMLKEQDPSDQESIRKLNADTSELKDIAERILNLECMEGWYLKQDFKLPVSIQFFCEGKEVLQYYRCKVFHSNFPEKLVNLATYGKDRAAAEIFLKENLLYGTKLQVKPGTLKRCSEDTYKMILFAKEVSHDQA